MEELPERELELLALMAREIAALNDLTREIYGLIGRIGGQRRRLEELEKLFQGHRG